MADLLRTGHTMLNIACPICNNPIFRNKEGKKFCPSCNREVVVKKSNNAQNFGKSETVSKDIQNVAEISDKEVVNSIKFVIIEKIQLLIEKLELETEIEHIKTYTEVLSNLYNLFKSLSEY